MSHQRYSTTKTTNTSTSQVLWSTVVPEGTQVTVEVDFSVTNAGLTNGLEGTAKALFIRPVGGNTTRATGSGGVLSASLNVLGNFLTNPGIDIVANTTNQTAEFRVTPNTTSNLTWKFTPEARRN